MLDDVGRSGYSRMALTYGSGLQFMVVVLIQVISAMESSASYSQASARSPVVHAAINTRHKVDYQTYEIPAEKPYVPNLIEVKSSVPSVMIKFNSASSKVNVVHQHQSSSNAPTTSETFSEDEPHVLRHQVIKPIIQEVHEVISPYRKIVQQINPVQEEINTIVASNTGGSGHSTAYQSAPLAPVAPPAPPPPPPAPMPIVHQPNNNGLLLHQALDGGGEQDHHQDMNKKQPDLILLNENELIDNSLYNGNNEFDLKYVSPNRLDGPSTMGTNHRLYEDR